MNVPFVDMKRLHEPLRDQILSAFERVLESGNYAQGIEVASLEREFADSAGGGQAVAVSNGTAALHLALLALGVGPGDEVITVSNTFFATAEAISAVGAIPVFADIESDGFNMDPGEIERHISPRTKAIVPVHLYGEIADMQSIMDIARRHGLRVIEDSCQAHGASDGSRTAGTFADAGCFSFYPTKNLGAVGEGGMVTTRDPDIANSLRELRDHGQATKHDHRVAAFNYRMSELQAAGLRVALPELTTWNEMRRQAARRYFLGLLGSGLTLPRQHETRHVYHLLVVRTARRDALRDHLARRGIATAIHYPVPIHLQPAYAHLGLPLGSLPRTEKAVTEILSLPFHPHITAEEVEYVCEVVRDFEANAAGRTLVEAAG